MAQYRKGGKQGRKPASADTNSPTPPPVRAAETASRLPTGWEWLLLLLPIAYIVLAVQIAELRGPFRLGANLDPEYQYLFFSTELADLHIPSNHQHPGTPVVILGAIVVTLGWLFLGFSEGWGPKIISVINHQDGYMMVMSFVFVVLAAGLSFLASRRVYRLTGFLPAAIVVPLWPFLSFLAARHSQRVSPEPMGIVLGLALLYVLAPIVLGPRAGEEARRPGRAIVLGLVLGLYLATKFIYVAAVPLLLLLPGFRQKARAVAAMVGSLLVLLVPVFATVSRTQSFLSAKFGESVGGGGSTDAFPAYLRSLQGLMRTEDIVPWALGILTLVTVTVSLWCWRADDQRYRRVRNAALVSLLCMAAHLVFISIRYRQHYLLPAISFAFLAFPFVLQSVRLAPLRPAVKAILITIALIPLVPGWRDFQKDLGRYKIHKRLYHADLDRAAVRRAEQGDCLAISYNRSSLPNAALFMGSDFTGARYAPELKQVHPDTLQFGYHTGTIPSWDHKNRWADIERRVAEGECVLVQGETTQAPLVVGWQLRPVFIPERRRSEGVYRLSLDAANPTLITSSIRLPNGYYVEAEDFSTGNLQVESEGELTTVSSTGEEPGFVEYVLPDRRMLRYAIRIRYASAEPRPVKVRLNGELVFESACPIPTGGFGAEHQKWHDLGLYTLKRGENILRLESDGPFPKIDQIVVRPVRKQ